MAEVINFKWEYITRVITTDTLTDELNSLGSDGWEVVAILNAPHLGKVADTPKDGYQILFKRWIYDGTNASAAW